MTVLLSSLTFNLEKGIAGPLETGYTRRTKGAHNMIRWLPFILVSLLWASLGLKDLLAHRYRRIWWWLGCWGLNALTWTPITITLGNSVGEISSFEWAGGTWVLIPLQRASIDLSFWANIVMTVPQGMLLQFNWSQTRWPRWLLAGLATGLTLETGQAIFNACVHLGRWVDINDVLTNCLGVIIGAACMWGLQRHFRWLN